mgnify:CR=1 FL=1
MGYTLKNFEYWTNAFGEITSVKMAGVDYLRWPIQSRLSENYLTNREIQDITTNLAHSFQFIEFIGTFKSEGVLTSPMTQQFNRAFVFIGGSMIEALLYLCLKNKFSEVKPNSQFTDLIEKAKSKKRRLFGDDYSEVCSALTDIKNLRNRIHMHRSRDKNGRDLGYDFGSFNQSDVIVTRDAILYLIETILGDDTDDFIERYEGVLGC